VSKIKKAVMILLGFRKFIVMTAVLVVGIVFRVSGHIDGGEFVDLLKYTTIAFMSANGVEHAIEGIKSAFAKKS
jgi:hypothetical protein